VKILSVVGARPQLVKAAMMAQALRHQSAVQHKLVHTGQHYDQNMSGLFFEELGIPSPDFNLAIGSGSHGMQTGRMLEAVERILIDERPDWVVVYGDTNSTLAGALASSKLLIRTAHIEAGLRSFNMRMPEEINRILTDHVSTLLFAPTDNAARQLRREGIDEERIQVVGDLMYDAALHYAELAASRSRILQSLGVTSGGYALATLHRAENTNSDGRRLATILRALSEFSREMPVVLPLHPRTRSAVHLTGSAHLLDHICVIEPVGYLDMLTLEKNARLVATDSGGVQKEAFFYNVPCVTLRDETEWVELLEAGWNRLAPPHDVHTVLSAMQAALHQAPPPFANPYGDGQSTQKVIARLQAANHEDTLRLPVFSA
jgi:UDP-GlcNAc3NAcA epimerase